MREAIDGFLVMGGMIVALSAAVSLAYGTYRAWQWIASRIRHAHTAAPQPCPDCLDGWWGIDQGSGMFLRCLRCNGSGEVDDAPRDDREDAGHDEHIDRRWPTYRGDAA